MSKMLEMSEISTLGANLTTGGILQIPQMSYTPPDIAQSGHRSKLKSFWTSLKAHIVHCGFFLLELVSTVIRR